MRKCIKNIQQHIQSHRLYTRDSNFSQQNTLGSTSLKTKPVSLGDAHPFKNICQVPVKSLLSLTDLVNIPLKVINHSLQNRHSRLRCLHFLLQLGELQSRIFWSQY